MTTGVLVMAYGSPNSLDEVEAYLRDIRGGRAPSRDALDDLTKRYERTGIPTPLLQITQRQVVALQNELGIEFRVAIGMKHWHPYIRDGVEELMTAGIDRIVGVAMAPHYSRISIGGYEARVRDALNERLPFHMVTSWFEEPAFIEMVARDVRAALGEWSSSATRVFFTAHSLPERIIAEGDPYRDQLLASEKLVADAASSADHTFAYQSASDTGEPWLGPDIRDALTAYRNEGGVRAVVCPIGFVAEHLEILYDIDVEAMEHAEEIGLHLRRVRSPNGDPALVRAVAAAVRGALR